MRRSNIILILLVAMLAFAGCERPDCGCDTDTRQPVLFQYEYINHAWGYRHRGFLIDAEGRVKGFLQPSDWIFPDSMGMISKSDLEYNLSQCDTLCGQVDKRVLNENFSKISYVKNGKIQDNGLIMVDAGTGVLSAWYWNDRARKYENVFLISSGDRNRVNTNSYVQGIADWLKKVGEKTNRFFWYGGK
jgi:hypothetical protein